MDDGSLKRNEAIDILIAEDSEIQGLSLKRFLEETGYRVRWGRNGEEALRLAKEKKPDIVLSDIVMPVMDGFALTKGLKADESLKDVPVVLLTQLSEVEDVIKGLDSGAEFYLTKPYDKGHLFSRLKLLSEDPRPFRNNPGEKTTEFTYDGRRYSVRSSRTQTMSLLLSTYENAVIQAKKLSSVMEELKILNESLEERVTERTVELTREVAERRLAEDRLQASEERFRALVDSASDAVICLEPPGKIYMWNRKAKELFGFSEEEAMGKAFHDLVVPDGYRQKADKGLEEFFRSGAGEIVGKTLEMTALRKGGEEFPVELSVAAFKIGEAWNTVGIVRDITERKRQGDELKRNLNELERMNKLMVGRELKMEELREEVRALRQRLKEIQGA